MGKSFTLNVFGFVEVLCMIKMLEWCDASVDISSLAILSFNTHIYNSNSNKASIAETMTLEDSYWY